MKIRKTLWLVLVSVLVLGTASFSLEKTQVVVVGAGISGLTAGLELAQKGVDVIVLEKDARVGGRMQSVDFDGVACNVGTAWVNDNFSSKVDPYIKRFPLQPLSGSAFIWKGKMIELKGDIMASLPFSNKAKKDLVASIAKMNRDAAALYPGVDFKKQKNWDYVYNLPINTPLWKKLEKMTIRQYLAEFDPDVTTIWGTRVSGGFGGNPDNISALFLVGWYRGELFFPMTVIKGGNNLLPEEMAKEFKKTGGQLLLKAEVTEIIQQGKSVSLRCRDGRIFSANYVIFTAPASVATKVIKGLSPRKYQALAAVKYVPLVGVGLQVKNFPNDDKFRGALFFQCGNSAAFMVQSGKVAGHPKTGIVMVAAITNKKKTGLSDKKTLAMVCDDIKMISPSFDPKKDLLGYKIQQFPIGEVHMSPGFLSQYGATLKEPAGNIYFGGEYASNFPTWGGGVWAADRAAKAVLKNLGKN